MSASEKAARLWFRIGLLGLLLLSLALRFWGLGRFNTLVFDEVYYVKFAHNYLTQTPFFDGHPPLSKYLIAIGIWLGNQLPIGQGTVNAMAGAPYTSWSYRWLNALLGSLIPLVVAAIAYQVSHRRTYGFIAGFLVALDGLYLVESRYALNNVHLVLFGLLGQWFFLKAIEQTQASRWAWLALAGVGFGASASIKWNGLWFLLGAYFIWGGAWAGWLIQRLRGRFFKQRPNDTVSQATPLSLQRLTQIGPVPFGLCLGLVPFLVYYLSWIPHIRLNPGTNFWDLQRQILVYHEGVGAGPNVHPYCSTWYSWPLLIRPVAYFYQTSASPEDPTRALPPPDGAVPGQFVFDVHAIGNPFLWWLAAAAIVLVLLLVGFHLLGQLPIMASPTPGHQKSGLLQPTEFWIASYLVANYLANWLPWMRVTRCIFLYHYMGSVIFAFLALAWILDRWLHSQQANLRTISSVALLLVLVGFLFWLPIYLGLPLTPTQFQLRFWFPSWM